MKRNVIFDLDGTLTDSGPGIKNSVRYTLNYYGLPMESDEQLNRYVGPPIMVSFRDYMGFTDPDRIQEGIKVYRSYFTQKGMFENQVYEGITPLLDSLKAAGFRLFIATGKPTVYSLQILEHFQLAHYFDRVCGIGLDESEMEKDELIAQVLTAEQLDPADCLMVGDRKFDMIGAAKVGMESIGVAYGYGTVEELIEAGACHVVHTVKALQQFLLKE